MKSIHLFVLALLAMTTACSVTPQAVKKAAAPVEDKPYPFTFCVVSGEELGTDREPYIVRHEGQIYKLCCKDCFAEFKADPAPHVQKFNDLVAQREQQAAESGP